MKRGEREGCLGRGKHCCPPVPSAGASDVRGQVESLIRLSARDPASVIGPTILVRLGHRFAVGTRESAHDLVSNTGIAASASTHSRRPVEPDAKNDILLRFVAVSGGCRGSGADRR